MANIYDMYDLIVTVEGVQIPKSLFRGVTIESAMGIILPDHMTAFGSPYIIHRNNERYEFSSNTTVEDICKPLSDVGEPVGLTVYRGVNVHFQYQGPDGNSIDLDGGMVYSDETISSLLIQNELERFTAVTYKDTQVDIEQMLDDIKFMSNTVLMLH
ncbi:hypothetical protein IWW37_005045 [Coemansia sp. RSA 2050]|nr:hypothetical protein IWW37_005045 [Coemansia sp. RSA 2050]KAJ2730525.1 hypothetical protein IW152_005191 [Coemansia sp. BCRC 34962]